MKQLKLKTKPKKSEGAPAPASTEAAAPPPQTAALTKKSLAALQRSHTEEETGKRAAQGADVPPPRPTPLSANVPVAGAAGLSAHRAGSAPQRDDASVISSSTANHGKRQQQQGEVKFTSFLDEVPVEACLEYLTRPHRSWDSAAKSLEYRRERIEGHNASVFARSLNVSRNSSYMEGSMRSIASAPAGFPKTGTNSSKTKTGSLVPGGRLGSETPPAAMDAVAAFDLTVTSAAGIDRAPSRASTAVSQRTTSPAAVVKGSTVKRPAPAAASAKKSSAPKGKKGGKGASSKQGDGGSLNLMIEPTVTRKR